MIGRVAGAICLLLASPCRIGGAETAAASRQEATAPSAALAALLSATDATGRPVVAPSARTYYDALPARARGLVETAVADEVITSSRHLAAILSLDLSAPLFEVAMGDRCFLCHSDPEVHSGDTLLSPDPGTAGLPAHMNLLSVVTDVHFRQGLSCAGCHGGDSTAPMAHDHPPSWPADAGRRRTDRGWIPAFCGRCHSDSAFMRRFNPALPTDQVEKFRESRHGMLLASGDSRAAQCVSCHGVHGIQGAKSPRSTVYPTRVPETCATCHSDAKLITTIPTNQFEQYRGSVHGRALLERGDLGAPACNDCHGNHASTPPQVASVAHICRTCHSRNGTLFDGSKHKEAFVAHGWPECDVCHGKHATPETSDAMLAPGPESLCEGCHAQYATANPECAATAAYFHRELVRLATSHASFTERAELLARKGLDVEAMDEQLSTLFDGLQQSRSYVHTFDRSEFDQVAAQARASVVSLTALETTAEASLRYRRLGLSVAVVLIALLILLIWIKLRRMESSGSS